MDIVAFHRNAVSDARRRLNPSIPERDADGIVKELLPSRGMERLWNGAVATNGD